MKKNTKKDQIITDVIPVFVELGYSNATMRIIASRLGMNLSLVTYYFESKEQLYNSCTKRSLEVLLDFVEERLLQASKDVQTKEQAEKVLIQAISEYTLKALSDKSFREYSKLLDRSLVEYQDINEEIGSKYLGPVYCALGSLLKFISGKELNKREIFLQVYSIVGLATIYIRDYSFVFKENLDGGICEEDYTIVERVIHAHLKVLISTISSGI